MEKSDETDLDRLAGRIRQIQEMVDELKAGGSRIDELERRNRALDERNSELRRACDELTAENSEMREALAAATDTLDAVMRALDASGLGGNLSDILGTATAGGGTALDRDAPESYETDPIDEFLENEQTVSGCDADERDDSFAFERRTMAAVAGPKTKDAGGFGFSSREVDSDADDRRIVDEFLEESDRDTRRPRIRPPEIPDPSPEDVRRAKDEVEGLIGDFVDEKTARSESLREILGLGELPVANNELDGLLDEIDRESAARTGSDTHVPSDDRPGNGDNDDGDSIDRLLAELDR